MKDTIDLKYRIVTEKTIVTQEMSNFGVDERLWMYPYCKDKSFTNFIPNLT